MNVDLSGGRASANISPEPPGVPLTHSTPVLQLLNEMRSNSGSEAVANEDNSIGERAVGAKERSGGSEDAVDSDRSGGSAAVVHIQSGGGSQAVAQTQSGGRSQALADGSAGAVAKDSTEAVADGSSGAAADSSASNDNTSTGSSLAAVLFGGRPVLSPSRTFTDISPEQLKNIDRLVLGSLARASHQALVCYSIFSTR